MDINKILLESIRILIYWLKTLKYLKGVLVYIPSFPHRKLYVYWSSVCLSRPFAGTRYVKDACRKFLYIWNKLSLELKEEFIRFGRSKATAASQNPFLSIPLINELETNTNTWCFANDVLLFMACLNIYIYNSNSTSTWIKCHPCTVIRWMVFSLRPCQSISLKTKQRSSELFPLSIVPSCQFPDRSMPALKCSNK